MGEDQVRQLEVTLHRIEAALAERCEHRRASIEKNARDVDAALYRLSTVEQKVTKLTIISSLATSVITAALVKFVVG